MTDEELAAERLAALLDAERENTTLRKEIGRLRGERAAIVAWLRERGEHDHERNHHRAEALWDAAAVIEHGEHRKQAP